MVPDKSYHVRVTNNYFHFSSNHNIYKSLCGLYSCASDTLIDSFYKNQSIKRPGVQKQRPHKTFMNVVL